MSRLAAFTVQIWPSPLPALFALSVAAYLALAVLPQAGGVVALCGDIRIVDLGRLALSAPLLWSPGQLAADWGLMVVAMMTPLTALQVAHVRRSSLRDLRGLATAAFLAAYWATWFVSILLLFPLSLAITSAVGPWADFPAALLLALVFGASPAAQRARNRCHRTGRIAAFGTPALAGCTRQGIATGTSCVAACWPAMLVPMTVQSWHLALMILVGVYLFADRIAPASPPAWRLPPALETMFGPLWPGTAPRMRVSAPSRR